MNVFRAALASDFWVTELPDESYLAQGSTQRKGDYRNDERKQHYRTHTIH